MTPLNEIQNARDETLRGDQALHAAEELLRLGLHNDAISRAYYAAYHWARAVLLTEGLQSRTHRGVNQLLGLHFIRTGRLHENAATLLAQLEDRRETSDYSAVIQFSEEESRDCLEKTRTFITLCRPLIDLGR